MARKSLSNVDASEFERYNLDYLIEQENKKEDKTKYLSVEEAIKEEAVYKRESSRDEVRVLFVSRDETLLNPTQQSLDGYTDVSNVFDEVHILILREGIRTKSPVLRVAKNVWLYTATNKDWWLSPFSAWTLAKEQLVFANGFRPDLIVARDPFESAALAIYMGKKYKRPVQIHVLDNYFKPDFLEKGKHNRWRRLLARFTIPRVDSVRASTKTICDTLTKHFKVKDLTILPRFNNYEKLISIEPTIDLKNKYKPLVFTMLYIGELTHESSLYKVIDAGRFGLRNPHIGLIVLGDGPARKEFKKRAEMLGIERQVIFERNVNDVIPYLKSASVLMIPDTDKKSEELALKGAAAGIPMVMSRTHIREDIFVDGESALMCDPQNTDEFSLKLNVLMNDIPLRKHMVESAQNMIREKFHDDPKKYRTAYRNSIEKALFLEEGEVDGGGNKGGDGE